MKKRNRQSEVPSTDALVDDLTLDAAITETPDAGEPVDFRFVEGEPLLAAYLQNGMLQIIGKLALAGANTGTVRGVATDLHRMLSVCARALRDGYLTLLDDFMPEDEPMSGNESDDDQDSPEEE